MKYSDLASYVLLQVPNCPLFQIEQALRDSAIEFCEKTDAYLQEIEDIQLIAGVDEYDLSPPSGTVINHVLDILRDGQPLAPVGMRYIHRKKDQGKPVAYTQTDSNTLIFAPTPKDAETLKVFYSVKPSQNSSSVPDAIAKENTETLVHGALWRLYRIAGTPWSSMETAATYYEMFRRGMGASIRKVRHGYSGATLSVQVPEFF